MKDFNLSEKIGWTGKKEISYNETIKIDDIKEFIRLVKENINEYWTNGEGQCICPECWEHRESDEKRVEDCMFLRMFKEIDKLAGEQLTEQLKTLEGGKDGQTN